MTNIVDFKVGGPQHRSFGNTFHSMPKRCSHSREEFADAKWLVDEIGCAQIQRFNLLGLAVARRQYDNWHVGPWPYLSNHILAVAVGQTDIENDDVRTVG